MEFKRNLKNTSLKINFYKKKIKNMSGLENLKLDDLGVTFLDLDTFEKE